MYDTLLHADPDGTVKPWLATEWSYNADNTVLTMKLRDDVTFTDGTKFDASAAAQNLLRFRDGTSPQKGYLATLADAKAVDATTLELTLSAPNPSLLSFLTQNPGLQQSPATFGAADEKTNPVGTGPYVLDTKSTVVGSTYVFTKNPDYWAPEQQHYAKIVMNVLQRPDCDPQRHQGWADQRSAAARQRHGRSDQAARVHRERAAAELPRAAPLRP